MKFPPEFEKKVETQAKFPPLTSADIHGKVDMRKVNLQVIRPWIVNKVIELVGFEDEVVVEYAMGLLEDNQEPVRRSSHFRALGCRSRSSSRRHPTLVKCRST